MVPRAETERAIDPDSREVQIEPNEKENEVPMT